MKKIILKTVSSVILAGLFICMLSILPSAELKASFSLKGPTAVRAGDSVSLQIKADGEGVLGIRAEISYDKSQLTYSSSSGPLSKWKVEITEENGKLSIWAEENNDFKSPINSSVTLIKLNFKASEKLKENDKITVKLNVLEASSTEDSIENISASYSVKVSKPLSDNCDLASLSVEGYELTPSFSPDVTEYAINGEVAYTPSPVKVNAKAADSEADVDISGTRLSVGENTIKIRVTAEDGKNVKTYTVKAVMAQDPDYVPSSDASLSDIKISEGKLSPPFAPSIHDYIVYVPYETVSVSVSSTASDSRSTPPAAVNAELAEGENTVILKCISEDGTESEYTVKFLRMPSYYTEETDTGTSEVTDTGTDTDEVTSSPDTDTEPAEITVETEPPVSEPESDTSPAAQSENGSDRTEERQTDGADTEPGEPGIGDMKFPIWVVLIALIAGLVIGGGVAIFIFNFSNERK